MVSRAHTLGRLPLRQAPCLNDCQLRARAADPGGLSQFLFDGPQIQACGQLKEPLVNYNLQVTLVTLSKVDVSIISIIIF